MLRIRVVSSGQPGGPGLNTWYFATAPEDAATALSCVTRVHAALETNKRIWASGTTLNVLGDVDVMDAGSGDITDTLSVAAPAAVVNTSAGDTPAPFVVSSLLRFSTGTFLAGRRVRGRSFLSPVPKTAIETTGAPTAFHMGLVVALGAALAARGESDPIQVIWHRPVGGVGGQACPVTAHSSGLQFAELRSRRD